MLTLECLRSVDGENALYIVNHQPQPAADAALALDSPNESLYRRLSKREGLEVYGGHRWLEAVAVNDRTAELLKVEPGTPVAFIQSVTWDEELRPFLSYRAWLRTDRIRIDVQVSPGAATAPLDRQPRTAPDGAAKPSAPGAVIRRSRPRLPMWLL
jgi:DNA-binding GntR family transcriptional regulator